jgi:hypothetical protein
MLPNNVRVQRENWCVMKRNIIAGFALTCLISALLAPDTKAGSAVASDGHGGLATAYGGPVQREKQRALDIARRKYGPNVRILAATDVTGYGAIAVARHPNGYGSIICPVLGRRSASEADTLAIKHCLKAGGTNPQVKWGWWG